MKKKKEEIKWAILTTGWGRNAKNLIEDFNAGKLKSSIISLLIHTDTESGAALAAKKHGIESLCILKNDFESIDAYQIHLTEELKSRNIDFIFLLAYGYIIRKELLDAFQNRIVNIHPSLLPSFGKTAKAIQLALAHKVKVTGITTHIIDEKLDEGVILCQEVIKIKDNDTFETLDPKFVKKGRKIIKKTIKYLEKEFQETKRDIDV